MITDPIYSHLTKSLRMGNDFGDQIDSDLAAFTNRSYPFPYYCLPKSFVAVFVGIGSGVQVLDLALRDQSAVCICFETRPAQHFLLSSLIKGNNIQNIIVINSIEKLFQLFEKYNYKFDYLAVNFPLIHYSEIEKLFDRVFSKFTFFNCDINYVEADRVSSLLYKHTDRFCIVDATNGKQIVGTGSRSFLVTFIVHARGDGFGLFKTISSLLSSDDNLFEIIIVSSEEAHSELKLFSSLEINRLKIFLVEASNIHTALNSAVEIAAGRYVMFLSNNIEIITHFFDTLSEKLVENSVDLLILPYLSVNPDGSELSRFDIGIKHFDVRSAIKSLRWQDLLLSQCFIEQFVFRKMFLVDNEINFNAGYFSNLFFYTKALICDARVNCLPQLLIRYNNGLLDIQRFGSRLTDKRYIEIIDFLEKCSNFNLFKKEKNWKLFIKYLYNYILKEVISKEKFWKKILMRFKFINSVRFLKH